MCFHAAQCNQSTGLVGRSLGTHSLSRPHALTQGGSKLPWPRASSARRTGGERGGSLRCGSQKQVFEGGQRRVRRGLTYRQVVRQGVLAEASRKRARRHRCRVVPPHRRRLHRAGGHAHHHARRTQHLRTQRRMRPTRHHHPHAAPQLLPPPPPPPLERERRGRHGAQHARSARRLLLDAAAVVLRLKDALLSASRRLLRAALEVIRLQAGVCMSSSRWK